MSESKYDYKDMQGWNKGMPMFYIEKRIGIIAVIDSRRFDDKKHFMNIKKGLPGVVWARNGDSHVCVCKICGNSRSGDITYDISDELVKEAVKIADKLNDEQKE